jgi:hypothetical protein
MANGNRKKPFIDLGGPIDLGFGIDLPKVSTPRPSSNINTGPMPKPFGMSKINTGMRSIQAGSSFDTTNSFKGLLATSKGGKQEIKISKEDIAKLRAGFKKFSQGGEALGRGLRKGGGARSRLLRGPLQSPSNRSRLEAEKAAIQKRLMEIDMPQRPRATPKPTVLSGIRKRLGF